MRALIEYMYCGETCVQEKHYKQLLAAAAMYKIKGLQCLESELTTPDDSTNGNNQFEHLENLQIASINCNKLSTDVPIHLPPPLFLNKKPKIATTTIQTNDHNIKPEKSPVNMQPLHKKIKRKSIRNEAERACAKEAAASHMALELLKKEIATSQFGSFVVEETCTETTVENFIPHNEDIFIDNDLHTVPIQLNYDFNNQSSNQIVAANLLPYIVPSSDENVHVNIQNSKDDTTSRINQNVNENIQNNLKILLKTDTGNFINVKNIAVQKVPEGLQYQIINESSQTNKMQEIKDSSIYIVEKDMNKKFNQNIHKFINISSAKATTSDDTTEKCIENEHQEQESQNEFNSNHYEDLVEVDYTKLNQPNFNNLNFIFSETSEQYPVFIPTTSKDPLSEACDIAENLSMVVEHKDNQYGCTYNEVSTNRENPETDLSSKSNQNKYLINDKVLVERNFVEYSPRNLQ